MKTVTLLVLSMSLMTVLVVYPCQVSAQPAEIGRIAEQLKTFDKEWSAAGWIPLKGSGRQPYMRKQSDTGWQTRMSAFRSLVLQGGKSIPVLKDMLGSKASDRRILAAQVLSFLRPQALRGTLIDRLHNDDNASVRLYSADALGTLKLDGKLDWSEFKKTEKNGDVRKHAGYAAQRKGAPVRAETLETLRKWDPKSMMTARLGRAAPEFLLDVGKRRNNSPEPVQDQKVGDPGIHLRRHVTGLSWTTLAVAGER